MEVLQAILRAFVSHLNHRLIIIPDLATMWLNQEKARTSDDVHTGGATSPSLNFLEFVKPSEAAEDWVFPESEAPDFVIVCSNVIRLIYA